MTIRKALHRSLRHQRERRKDHPRMDLTARHHCAYCHAPIPAAVEICGACLAETLTQEAVCQH